MKPELRLVAVAASAWACGLVATAIPGARVGLAVLSIVTSIGCIGIAIIRARGGILPFVSICLMAVSVVACSTIVVGAQRDDSVLISAATSDRRVDVDVHVTAKTVLRRASSALSFGGDKYRISGTATSATIAGETFRLSVPVLAFAPAEAGSAPPAIGSVVRIRGAVVAGMPSDQAAITIFADDSAELVSQPPWYLGWADGLRSRFVALCDELPGPGGQLLPGLAVGDTTAVPSELDQAMKTSSLSHLTAVSGANCAIVVGATMMALGLLGVRRRWRVLISLVVLGGFVILVTPEPSVVRAAVMATAVLGIGVTGRPARGIPVLALTVVVLLAIDPWLSSSYGFALSVLATAGLLFFAAPLTRILRRWLPHWLAMILAVPLAAQIACQPVLIMLDSSLPAYGVVANLLAAPAAPVGTIVGLVACLATGIPIVATGAAWVAWVPAAWIAGTASTVAALPGARLPWVPGIGGLVLLVALSATGMWWLLSERVRRRPMGMVLVGILVIAGGSYAGSVAGSEVSRALNTPKDWSIAACDIGQGDAVVVRSEGKVALVDTGPDPKLLADCLEQLGIVHVDLLILTHFDLDHIGGTDAVVGHVTDTFAGPVDDATGERLLERIRTGGSTVSFPKAGDATTFGAMSLRVLWPRSTDTQVGNPASVTVEFDGDGIRSLFLGDLGEESQRALLGLHSLRDRYDLVKVAHHGSADQYAALYERIQASVALISVGADNDYGHPTHSALAMLAKAGSTVFRTDTCGLVLVSYGDQGLRVWTERRSP